MNRRDLLIQSAVLSAAIGSGGVLSAMPKASMPLRILILGGTGFTGPHQVRYALARGHQVTLFNRGKRAKQNWPGTVTELIGDRDTADLKALKSGEWDVVIDNPTTLPHWVRDAAKILQKRTKHYIFISTISVFSDNSKANDENAALAKYLGKDALKETQASFRANLGELYGPLKAASEAETKKWFPNNHSIIRPGLIVGPGDETDRFTYWPARLSRGGDVLAPGDGNDPVQFIDARDLAEWTIRVAENRSMGVFNATGPDYGLSMAAFLHAARAVSVNRSNLIWASTEFLDKEKVSAWADMPVWVPGSGDSYGFARTKIDRALAAGLSFRALADTCRDTLIWFQSQPDERKTKLRAGITSEREKEILAKLPNSKMS